MDSILVISNEPALAETLASELSEVTIAETRPGVLSGTQDAFRLIVADEGIDENALGELKAPILRLTRPVRLSALLYTIREKLQSKSASPREDMAFAPSWQLCAGERLLRHEAGALSVSLTEKEVELLVFLLEQKNNPVMREAILKRVWGYSAQADTHTLETHIYRLRGKLRQADPAFDIVFSEDKGYRLHV
jgi:hypothetical protein